MFCLVYVYVDRVYFSEPYPLLFLFPTIIGVGYSKRLSCLTDQKTIMRELGRCFGHWLTKWDTGFCSGGVEFIKLYLYGVTSFIILLKHMENCEA